MSDPVSWLLVETGWKVVDSNGDPVGTVAEVRGDTGNDIFSGLAVSGGLLGRSRFVPSENVAEIVEGCIRLDLDHDAVKALEEPG
jgi:sporulation protein YlmC with PRC-barrel domain